MLFWKFVLRTRPKLEDLLQWNTSNVKSFQYKVLNNLLYLNRTLIIFGKSSLSSLCLFCKNAVKTIFNLFYECNITRKFWKSLIFFFDKYLNLLYPTPQTGFWVIPCKLNKGSPSDPLRFCGNFVHLFQ